MKRTTTSKLLRRLFKMQHRKCHYCGIEMILKQGYGTSATIDHMVPKCHGGTRHPRNVVAACWACNNAKGDTGYDTFKQRIANLGRPDGVPSRHNATKPWEKRRSAEHIERERVRQQVLASDARWKPAKTSKRAYVDQVGKYPVLADVFEAIGLVPKKEQS